MKCAMFMINNELKDRYDINLDKIEEKIKKDGKLIINIKYILNYKLKHWQYFRKRHFNLISDLIEYLYSLNGGEML